jgi:hypothetical protein
VDQAARHAFDAIATGLEYLGTDDLPPGEFCVEDAKQDLSWAITAHADWLAAQLKTGDLRRRRDNATGGRKAAATRADLTKTVPRIAREARQGRATPFSSARSATIYILHLANAALEGDGHMPVALRSVRKHIPADVLRQDR